MVYKKIGGLRKKLQKEAAEAADTETSVATATTSSTEYSSANIGGWHVETTNEDIRFRKEVIAQFKENPTVKYQDCRKLKDWAFTNQKPNFKRTFEGIKEEIVGSYISARYDFIEDVSFTERAAAKQIIKGRCQNIVLSQQSSVEEMGQFWRNFLSKRIELTLRKAE